MAVVVPTIASMPGSRQGLSGGLAVGASRSTFRSLLTFHSVLKPVELLADFTRQQVVWSLFGKSAVWISGDWTGPPFVVKVIGPNE